MNHDRKNEHRHDSVPPRYETHVRLLGPGSRDQVPGMTVHHVRLFLEVRIACPVNSN